LTSTLANPQQLLENEERMNVLSWALESLPENQKIAFTLSKYEELSYQEIADILDTTIPSVESLLFRAKLNMKKKLYRFYKEHV
jgi:RNA polymerase sigma-70 factor (ECF subfamily)